MRIAGETVGRRGAIALSTAAVMAAILAVHGYGHPGSLGLAGSSTITGTGTGGPTAAPSPQPSGASSPAPSSSAAPTAAPTGSATPGPLLSSTPYAGYTYQLYPGTLSTSAQVALAGFAFKAHSFGPAVTFTLSINAGGQAPITKTYPSSDHVYFVEANLGDDSANTEYNYGDDGLVVTDASGHVVA